MSDELIFTDEENINEIRAKLLGSLLFHCQFFFKTLTEKDFILSAPTGRESHMITICRELTAVFRLEKRRLILNLPPGHFKTTFLCLFVTWAYAHYPDCQFIFISYGFVTAVKATSLIKRIMQLREYGLLYGVYISKDKKANDDFMTTAGGRIKAFGSDGPITGFDAGLPGLDRFSGGVIYDDPHKAKGEGDEKGFVPTSMTEINSAITNYSSTVISRPRGWNVPIIVSGQRVREGDLSDYLLSGKDGDKWEQVVIQSLDAARNPLFPTVFPKKLLEQWEEFLPNFFAAQHQQNPSPSGGGLFKRDWFVMLEEDPEMMFTFITVDTSESAKTYADKTVFSFWGVYRIKDLGSSTNEFGIHCIDGIEQGLEPKDLKDELLSFYGECLRYKYPPKFVVIEKKSTGVTLFSVLNDMRGIQVRGVERTKASGSKSDRYLEMQQYIAQKRISFPKFRPHSEIFIKHLIKITDNDSHRYDDICDTLYDAIKVVFIDKYLYNQLKNEKNDEVSSKLNQSFAKHTNAFRGFSGATTQNDFFG